MGAGPEYLERFLDDLELLCEKHGVSVYREGYDGGVIVRKEDSPELDRDAFTEYEAIEWCVASPVIGVFKP